MSERDEAARIAEAVKELGLERLMALEPETVSRSWRLARAYAEGLGRPRSPRAEPAHVYRAREDEA